LRAIAEVLGVKNIVTKVWRSTNPSNVIKAAYKGLESMIDVEAEMKERSNIKITKEIN
jgi:ribosomal protein S5